MPYKTAVSLQKQRHPSRKSTFSFCHKRHKKKKFPKRKMPFREFRSLRRATRAHAALDGAPTGVGALMGLCEHTAKHQFKLYVLYRLSFGS